MDLLHRHRNRCVAAKGGDAGQHLVDDQTLLMLMLVLILSALGFAQRHLVDLGARWRFAVVGLLSTVMVWIFWQFPISAAARVFISPFLCVGSALLIFFGLIPAERSVRRTAPGALTSLGRLFTPLVLSPPVGLAILRGSCVGLALLGADTAAVWLGTSGSQFWLASSNHVIVTGLCLGNTWPSMYAFFAAINQASATTATLALFASLWARVVRRLWLALTLAAIVAVPFFVSPTVMAAIQPLHWKASFLMLDFLVLAWTFNRFDVLTLAWTAFTFAFCWRNYQLLVMLTPAGLLEPWIDFAVFGLIVFAATVVALQVPLRSAYRRTAAVFE